MDQVGSAALSAPCLLLSRRETGNTPVSRSCATRQQIPSSPMAF
jgi:hypothetical protein